MTTIEWEDFERVEIRAGTLVEASDFPEAHSPAYRVTVDFGLEVGVKKTSARLA